MHRSTRGLDKELFAEKAQAIYEQLFEKQLEATHRGQVVAIEVESAEAFTGRTALEASVKAREKFPDRLLYFVRVGFPAVHSLKGHGQRSPVQENA